MGKKFGDNGIGKKINEWLLCVALLICTSLLSIVGSSSLTQQMSSKNTADGLLAFLF